VLIFVYGPTRTLLLFGTHTICGRRNGPFRNHVSVKIVRLTGETNVLTGVCSSSGRFDHLTSFQSPFGLSMLMVIIFPVVTPARESQFNPVYTVYPNLIIDT
jgi:hypothetical protein